MHLPHPILLFDGDCAFCTRCVAFIDRHIPTTAEIVPWQFADLAALGVQRPQAEYEVVWVDREGRSAGGVQGIAMMLIDAGRWWAPLGYALRVPPIRWLAHLTYRLTANNRHRLPGGTPACALPPDQRPGAQRAADG